VVAEIPMTKSQIPMKIQIPNFNEESTRDFRDRINADVALTLVIGSWDLGFGHWDFDPRFPARQFHFVPQPSIIVALFELGIMAENVNHYEQERRQKRDRLRELGIDPYGGREEGVRPLLEIKNLYQAEMGHDGGPVVKAAGRILLKRDMGKKLSFLTLQDDSGQLQVALDRKRLDDLAWNVRDLLDLGDQIVVEGVLGVTNKGETTVWAAQVRMASKALLPPPAKWEGLSDVEIRYRQRYVDLWANPDVMKLLKMRIKIVDEIRRYLRDRGFLEVETPMMQPIAGGAAARPFVTHHRALDMPLYLRIAPELYLKRLLVGGFTKVFELNRNFRNEGISPRHNPEFTMLEAYEAFGSWETMADLVEGMICRLAETLFGGLKIVHKPTAGETTEIHSSAGDSMMHMSAPALPAVITDSMPAHREINLTRPWRRATMAELVEQASGWKFDKQSIAHQPAAFTAALAKYEPDGVNALARRGAGLELFGEEAQHAERLGSFEKHLLSLSPAEQLVELYEKLVEPKLIDPCFVTHVPSVIIPLARKNKDDPFFADVYELAINGQEISPGYSELNDPDVQAANFSNQVGDKDEQQKPDEDFLTALKYGMPPAGGMGLGIDRLVMMLTGAESIRDVILFPLMKPGNT
jgi:lysyl-tRNA synthetase, class II